MAFRVGHEDASVRQQRRGGDAARGLQHELGTVFAHDAHGTVERAAHQRAAGAGERDRADRGAVLEGAEQATFGKAVDGHGRAARDGGEVAGGGDGRGRRDEAIRLERRRARQFGEQSVLRGVPHPRR